MTPQCFLGVVSDNQDAESLHRVQVSISGKQDKVSEWMAVITPCAGSDTGFYALPDVGEQVLVVSLDDEHKQKVVLGSVWDTNAEPPVTDENSNADLNQDGENTLHFIKSGAGAMFIFDDTAGEEKIQLISCEPKTRLEFSAEDELVSFASEKDLTLGAKKILTIDAEDIEIKASKQFNCGGDEMQIKASKKLDINADQDITIKGSGIALN